jgi:VWFA-related protein
MRAIACVALLMAAAVLALGGQEQTPTFRTTTRLVEFTVTALDKRGAPVTDLRLEDFVVQDNGKPRQVAFLDYDGAPGVDADPLPLPPGVFTNRVEFTPGPARNITAFVLDELNTPTQFSVTIRAAAMRYLRSLRPGTRMAVFHMSERLRVLHDFTDDAAALRSRVAHAAIVNPIQTESDFDRSVVEAELFVDLFKDNPQLEAVKTELKRAQLEMEALTNAQARRSRLETTLESIETLGQHLAGIPGRKNLVWISGGISMLSVTGALGTGPNGSIQSFEERVKQTAQKLAQQGIVLYMVDAKGLVMPTATTMAATQAGTMPAQGRGRFEAQQQAETISADPHAAMELMASITGGRYLRNTNDLMDGFRQASTDLAGSYTLGFYVGDDRDSKWHNLKASVTRPGVSVRHRQGYLADAATARLTAWSPDLMMEVAANPIGSSAVRLTAQCVQTSDPEPGTLQVGLRIEAWSLRFDTNGANQQTQIQIIFAERSADGRTHLTTDTPTVKIPTQSWDMAQREGLRYARRLKPARDAVSLRIIVRDMVSGRYGTLDVPLKALPDR